MGQFKFLLLLSIQLSLLNIKTYNTQHDMFKAMHVKLLTDIHKIYLTAIVTAGSQAEYYHVLMPKLE